MTTANTAANLPRTSALGRLAILAALGSPQRSRTAIVAERWPDVGDAQRTLLVRTGGPMAANVNAPDVPASIGVGQLYAGIAQQTLLGKLNVLADVKLRSAFGGYAAGEPLGIIKAPGKPIPLLSLEFSQPSLMPITAAALVVISNELAEDANAEDGIRNLLLRATTRAADEKFIALALDGAGATASGADTPFQLRTQVREMVAALVAAGGNPTLITLAANPTTLVTLATAADGWGNAAFPTVTLTGGTLCGIPLLPSSGAADGVIVAVAGDAVLRAPGTFDIQRSEHASLEFSDAPVGEAQPDTTPVDQGAPTVDLWQANLSALRVMFTFGADFVRDTRAAFIDGVSLEGVVTA
jgi:hypothetical protein